MGLSSAQHRGGTALPAYASRPPPRVHHKHGKAHHHASRGEDSPLPLLLVLVLASIVAMLTLQSSRAHPAAGRELLEAPGGGARTAINPKAAATAAWAAAQRALELPARGLQRAWSSAYRTTPGPVVNAATAVTANNGTVRPPFNPATHQLYLDLPDLPEPSAETLQGGWQLSRAVYDYAYTHPAGTVLSEAAPRLLHFPDFLSPDEVAHFIGVSEPNLVRSEVLSASGEGDNEVMDVRTSSGYWPPEDAVYQQVAARIHRLVGIPKAFGEGIYVLNYKQGQRYEAHNDHCMDNQPAITVADPACKQFLQRAGGPGCGPGAGGPSCGDRVATFILILKHPTRGGQTAFPSAAITKERLAGVDHPDDHDWYCERPEVLAAAPKAGDALLFWDYEPGDGDGTGSYADGTGRPSARAVYEALHSGCAVVEGEKWIATRWIRGNRFW